MRGPPETLVGFMARLLAEAAAEAEARLAPRGEDLVEVQVLSFGRVSREAAPPSGTA